MRSRFLNTDYFSTSSSLVYETLGFLDLSVPDNFSAPVICDGEDDRLRFDSVEDFCLPIANLPIDAALSKFLSDVVPDRVSVDYEVFEIDDSSLGDHFSDEVNFLGFGDSQCLEVKFLISGAFVSAASLILIGSSFSCLVCLVIVWNHDMNITFSNLAVYMNVSVNSPWFLIVRMIVDFPKLM